MGNAKAVNAGVGAITGFGFQRNCALYFLLSDYATFKDKEFFLCMEHHDDFLFCYRADCNNFLNGIQAYQAKKRSGSLWKVDSEFSEIINKMLGVGFDLRGDLIEKTQGYNHILTFLSNTETEFKFRPSAEEKKKKIKSSTFRINEEMTLCHYKEIPEIFKDKIDESIEEHCKKNDLTYHKDELNNVYVQWVDFPRTDKAQKDYLVGIMKRNFPHVVDSVAAVDVLLKLFMQVEAVFNQGRVAKLLDVSKRVEGSDIKKTINIIEKEQKTYDLWREESKSLSLQFKLSIRIQKDAENYIKNTFELLKDMRNHEHQLIKSYVETNDFSDAYQDYNHMFDAYISNIKLQLNLNISDEDVFFAVLCSYTEYYS